MENTVLIVALVLLVALAFSYVPMAVSAMRKRRRGLTKGPNAPRSTDWSWATGANTTTTHHHHASSTHRHAPHSFDAGSSHHAGGFSGGHDGGGFSGGHH